MPVLPWITDDDANIAALVRRAGDAGAKNIICFPGMTLREGNREYYYDFLRRDFPGLRAKYEERFGNAYVCESPRASDLWETFTAECDRRHIVYTFPKLNAQISALWPRQMQLF